jgi:hypothetical protein
LFFPLAITSLVTLAITFFSALAVAFEATSLSRCLRPRLAPASRSPSLAIGPAVHDGQPLDTCSTFAPDVSECADLRVIISLMCCRSVGRYVTLGASGVDAASLARTHVRAREEKAFPLPPAIGLPPRSRRGRA